MKSPVLYLARAVCDARGRNASPGALLARPFPEPMEDLPLGVQLLACGAPDEVLSHPAASEAETIDLGDAALLPGLVNAHCHLDLTHIGPRPWDPEGGFVGWINGIRRGRAASTRTIGDSVRVGIERSLRGGVVAVGDIAGAGSDEPLEALRASPLIGVSFREFFGIGRAQAGAIEQVRLTPESAAARAGGVTLGLQPHAPYSAGLAFYDAAIEVALAHDLPLATHLAESPEERWFIAEGTGPLRDFLASLDLWTEDVEAMVGRGLSPVRHLAEQLRARRFLVAHCNDVSTEDIQLLSETGAVALFCPRAHAYFGREFDLGPHRFADMINAGVTVALGTDSIVNLPSADGAAAERLSTFDEMQILRRSCEASPESLLAMATIAGARALGLEESLFDFSPGPLAGVCVARGDWRGDSESPLEAVLDLKSPRLSLLLGENEYSI